MCSILQEKRSIELKGEEMEKLYIVIPAYNEQDTIKNVIDDWYPIVDKIGGESKLVIINDGSKDRTAEILNQYSESHERLIGLTKENGGHGAAVLYGYQYALDAGAEYIFQTDSDGQTVSAEFWDFWKQRQSYDMVIGHRTKRKDGFSRILVTKVLKLVLLLLFHVNVPDANTPFRLMKAGTLAQYLPLIPPGYNLSNVIISVIYKKKKQAVKYIPITFRPRQGGVNSINMKKIIGIGRQAWKDFRTINKVIAGSTEEKNGYKG